MAEVQDPNTPAKPQKISFVLLAVALGSYGLACLGVAQAGPSLFFTKELYVLAVIQLMLAGLLLVRSMFMRYLVFALRSLFLTVSLFVLDGRLPLVQICLILPLVADLALYLRFPELLSLALPPLLLPPLVLLFSQGGELSLVQGYGIASVLVLSLLGGGFFLLLSHYREELVTARKKNETLIQWVSKLTASNRAFQDYAESAAVDSKINERNRITRELHDSIGYSLTNLSMMMRAAQVLLKTSPDSLGVVLDQAQTQVDASLAESRKILHGLRDAVQEVPHGTKALIHLCATYSAAMGIAAHVEYGDFPASLGEELDAAVFRFVQEGLTNAFKHGHASRITILCQRSQNEIRISVMDNGTGSSAGHEGMGLTGMRERFAVFAGTVEAVQRDWGYCLSVSIPLQEVSLAQA